MDKIERYSIQKEDNILYAIRKMDENGKKLLMVFDGEKFAGLLSIGDIQRGIIKNVNLSEPVYQIMRTEVSFASPEDSIDTIRKAIIKERIEFMPIVDKDRLVDVIFWEDVVKEDLFTCKKKFDLPVVIMAGGVGSRMKPLTNVIPKPLIPIGEKTLMEDIMDRFIRCGSKHFLISVNYKADVIEDYFKGRSQYDLSFFQEKKPMGTAGSLTLIKKSINSTFFVSNCDTIILDDYSQILKYHIDNKNLLTVVSALKSFSLPYGNIETNGKGYIQRIIEKPELTFKVNTGMYIVEPSALDMIPKDSFFNITDLVDAIISKGGNVGCFPVSEKSWIDIGNWDSYIEAVRNYRDFKE